MRLLVSGVTKKDGRNIAYVRFEDGEKSAEATIPNCEFIANDGFDDKQIERLRGYLKDNMKEIQDAAKGVNPVSALMKDKPRG